MAKRLNKKEATRGKSPPQASARHESAARSIFGRLLSRSWIPVLLAALTFLVYWPSLKSDFVYDARIEIINEGFVTSLSNLPAILSLRVLGMHLVLADRPGQLLYLMLNAAIWGKEPWGYHLGSNLLHAANVALLFVFLRRLVSSEQTELVRNHRLKAQLAIVAATLIFALHPIAAEPVAGVSFSSDLLVTFFTLLTLLAATAFRPDKPRAARWIGGAGVFCAFAAVTCKESGLALALLLIVYWFLFRRGETKAPWFWFLGSALMVTVAFLAARFTFAAPNLIPMKYLGGSFSHVLLIQPRLWVFMMGKLLWPVQFSADYTLENITGLSTPLALVILVIVVSLQAWLAFESRLGALGVAVYWLGLATVSNFMPLYRVLADRFYYLPLAGVAMQLLALFLMTLKSRAGFWLAIGPFLAATVPLTALTLTREDVFSNDASLWTDTLRVSPSSLNAHDDLGAVLFEKGEVDEAMVQYQKAHEINPNDPTTDVDLGNALFQKGREDDAIAQYQKALAIDPNFAGAYYNLGNVLVEKGKGNEAIAQFEKAIEINPYLAQAHYNLGNVLIKQGRIDEAIIHYQKTLAIDPNYTQAHNNLGVALFQKGRVDEAVFQFQEVVRQSPGDTNAQNNLAKVEALAQQQKASQK